MVVEVTVHGDDIDEGSPGVPGYEEIQTQLVDFTNPVGAALASPTGAIDIRDDDLPPQVVPYWTYLPGDETIGQVELGLFGETELAVSVDVRSVDALHTGWAQPDVHYGAVDETVTFAPGETFKTVDVFFFGLNSFEFLQWAVFFTTNHVNSRPGGLWGIGLIEIEERFIDECEIDPEFCEEF